MTDRRSRLKDVDRIPVPDLWPEVRRRASAGDASVRMEDWPSSTGAWRRVVTAAVVLSLFAGSAVAVWIALRSEQGRQPGVTPTPNATPQPDPWRDLQPGLHPLPAPPIDRSGVATVWTGSELVMWGGATNDGARLFNDGFALDARSRTWDSLAPSPLSARYFPAAVWSGREVLIWGGWDGGNGFFDDGAAYDPATRTWRMLPPAPIEGRFPFGSVWTGREMLVWGGGRPYPGRAVQGAAYDPSTDAWRTIAQAPFVLNDGATVWTGDEMIVFGAWLGPYNRADTPTAVGAAYEPGADTWRQLPASELSPQALDAVWTGEEMLAVDYNHQVEAWNPSTDRWRHLPPLPLDDGEFTPQAAFAAGHVVVDSFGGMAVLRLRDESWDQLMLEPDQYLWNPIAVGEAFVLIRTAYEEEPTRAVIWKPVTDPDWKEGFAGS